MNSSKTILCTLLMFLIEPAPREARGLVGHAGQEPGAVMLRLPPLPLVGDSGCFPPRLQCLRRPHVGGENRRQPRTDAVPRASTVSNGVGSLSSRRRAAPAARAASSAAAVGRGGGGCGATLLRAAAGSDLTSLAFRPAPRPRLEACSAAVSLRIGLPGPGGGLTPTVGMVLRRSQLAAVLAPRRSREVLTERRLGRVWGGRGRW